MFICCEWYQILFKNLLYNIDLVAVLIFSFIKEAEKLLWGFHENKGNKELLEILYTF